MNYEMGGLVERILKKRCAQLFLAVKHKRNILLARPKHRRKDIIKTVNLHLCGLVVRVPSC
jgi:hypothetical protein